MSSDNRPHPEEAAKRPSRRTRDGGAVANPDLTFDWQEFGELSATQLYELLQFRQAVFVVEQSSPYPDLDGRDAQARHLTLRRRGGLIGCLRLIEPDDGPRPAVRIGRVAVAAAERGRGLARLMMVEGLRLADAGYRGSDLVIGAQTYLEPFYRSLGFAASSAPYDDYGVPHIDMVRRAAPG